MNCSTVDWPALDLCRCYNQLLAMKLYKNSPLFSFVLLIIFVTCQSVKDNKWKTRDSRSYIGLRGSQSTYNSNNNGTTEYGVSSLCPESYGSTGKKRLVCYYRVEESFRPYDLDPCLCTHIVYSYVAVKDNFAFIAGKKGKLLFLYN